ncbi:hypothetical protein PsorP6_004053 [Peronosclerospora sorghi]|uniref:Uncharacterized protein n=1 Tax=Peronosclerospora sorghi TaxID=230839 RepID=A0ACC0VLG7_9STRA|nr:hypothetical protein PsorP6_004053 [Peronosclerospora sorghi]
MWALDVVAGDGVGSDTTFYLIAGEWTVGRKHCHFNFRADSSISRTHALIRVGALTSEQLEDPLTRPPLELVDNNSRFGSFVNQEQSYETRRLYHGDRISFGAKKTVLRVRYQVFVLVASRIQRVNRSHLNDACKRIGMHLVPEATKDATHCIMDSGRIVATVKVLWALVYNQPVVCTAWIYAVLNRTSLSDPLPRCEDFLPSDPSIPSFEDKYLPNALRKTLYQGYAVVFLAPQSMEELILAMAGVVVAAYKNFDDDDKLVHELKFLASNKRLLLVEPEQATAFSGTAGQSEQQASTFKEHLYCVDVVERRVELFKSMGALFTSVQELAASVIFVKAPTTPDDSTFNNALAKYAGPSAQVTSFPEHLSLQSISVRERKDTALKSNLEVNVEDFSVDDIAKSTIKKDVEQLTDLQHGSDQVPWLLLVQFVNHQSHRLCILTD